MPEPIRCPKCGLINPPTAARCDCGYSFLSFTAETAADIPPSQGVSGISAPLEGQALRLRIGYFRQHWGGEHSLARSYWINCVLLSIVIIAALSFLGNVETDLITRAPVLFSLGMIAFWIFVYALTTWQLVGVFRSASKRLKTTSAPGQRFWGRAAQVVVVLGVFQATELLIVTAGPQMLEYSRIALGDEKYSKYTLRVLHQGTELEILGGISFGLTDDVQRTLAANPKIRVLHLNSIGGRIVEAKQLRDLIVSQQLITYSSRGCLSACTIAFMGGTERYLYKNASLGFHQPRFPGVPTEEIENYNKEYKTHWLATGVDAAFVEKAFSIPNKEMWKPTPEELLRAGVVNEVTDGADFAMSETGLGESLTNTDHALTEIPFYATMKKHDPDGYAQLLQEFQKGLKGDYSRKALVDIAREYSTKLFVRYAPRAADDPLIAMSQTMVRVLKQLGTQNPELCYAYLFPDRAGRLSPVAGISVELQHDMMQKMAQVVESAVTTPQLTPKEAHANKIIEEIGARLATRYGDDVAILANLEAPEVDKGKACALSTAMYEEVLRLPKKQSGEVLRFMYMQVESPVAPELSLGTSSKK